MASARDEEIRYHMCRPDQVRARRDACPVAYIPIGTLEWHGLHNPFGADTLQAEGLAALCARKGGGLVFPSLYYGESRSESLMEANAADREDIAKAMGLPPDNFLPERQPFSPTEQVLNYQRLLLHILAEAETLGFRLGVLVAGHYPLIDHARSAAILFNKRRYSRYHGMLAWACVDYLLVRDTFPDAGDHAAGSGNLARHGAAPRDGRPRPPPSQGWTPRRDHGDDAAAGRHGRFRQAHARAGRRRHRARGKAPPC